MSPAFTMTTKEGWRTFVDSPPVPRPETLTRPQIQALSDQAREVYNEARADWHANFGTITTPQLSAAHRELELIVATNRQRGDRLRGGAVLDGLPGLGKTTIVDQFARRYDRTQRARFGATTGSGDERVPVFRIGLTSKTTLRSLNWAICKFYGHPGLRRSLNADQLGEHALECVLSCETGIGVIDELHFVSPGSIDGTAVNNHLKHLANELPITFVFTGVGLAERHYFHEGLTGSTRALSQTGRRTTRIPVTPFDFRGDPDTGQDWLRLLSTTESLLVLGEVHPGMLVAMADYLYERTGGYIGSLVTLIVRGAFTAIRDGLETLTVDLLDRVRIDNAAEEKRRPTRPAAPPAATSRSLQPA